MFNTSVSILRRNIVSLINYFGLIKSFFFIFFKITFFTFFISVIIISCKKDTDVGLTTQPPGDKINTVFTDTLSIEAYTVKDDSSNSLGSSHENYGLLGNYNDPIFGQTSSSIIAQFLPTKTNINFGDSASIVSLNLYLDYTGYYGDLTKDQYINIYKLSKAISKDSTYYSSRQVSSFYNENDFVGNTFLSLINTNSNQLKVNLLKYLGDSILNRKTIASDSIFLTILNGLCITSDTSIVGGGIAYFNLTSGKSKLVLTYKKNNSSLSDSCEFVIKSNSSRFNLYTHNYSNSNFNTQINTSNPVEDSVFYIQPMSGVRGLIKMPTADKLDLKNNIAVVKATLIIPIEKNDLSNAIYPKPLKLMLFARQENNKYIKPVDFDLGEAFDGNFYSTESVYKFNISLHMQKIIDGSIPNLGFYLVSNDIGSCNRVVLTSGIHSNRLKLQISYTKF